MFYHADAGLFSKGERLFYLWLTLGLVLLVLLTSTLASARTWYIKADGTGDAPTILAGVDSAVVGDTVLVGPGTYASIVEVTTEAGTRKAGVHLYKNVCLIGDGAATTTIAGIGSDIGVFASDVEASALIRGFTVRTSGGNSGCGGLAAVVPVAGSPTGIWCERSAVRIENCRITRNDRGLYLFQSPATVSQCEFVDDDYAVVCESQSDADIVECTVHYCWLFVDCNGSSPRLIGNRFYDSCEGLVFDANSHPYLSGNQITAGPAMITQYDVAAVMLQSGGVLENNQFWQNSVGVWVHSSDTSTKVIRNNLFVLNALGVWASTSSHVLIENNTIDSGGDGIECMGDPETIVRNNIIVGGSVGIRCPSLPVISCNNVFGCTKAAYQLCPDQTGINGNISVEPQFCGIKFSGNYYLQSDSPCAPGNHPDGYECGLIGALPVNCGKVDVENKSWGMIKSLYKKDG
jgi:parallel beta-helix repeat protein